MKTEPDDLPSDFDFSLTDDDILPDVPETESGDIADEDDEDYVAVDSVQAKAAQDAPAPPDDIVSELMENITGVAAEWLAPVRPVFQRLAALAQSDRVSDEDFIEALEKANEEMPGLFEKLNTDALRKACEAALRAATADGLSEE